MISPTLSGSKLDGAEEHADRLRSLVESWQRKPYPYRFVMEKDAGSDWQFNRYRYVVYVSRELPSDELNKVFGDASITFDPRSTT